MAIAIANLAGAARIFATDINPERLEMAREMGADVLMDARSDVVGDLRRVTGGVGVDVVLEMSGAESAIRQGFDAVTNGGRVSLLGLPSRPITLDLNNEIIFKGVRVYGITGRKMFETWYRTQALLAQGLDVSPIVTHRIPLTRFEEAFELLAGGHAGKVVLLPQEA
jgi:threonine 3-dehydrogenase